MTNTTRWGRCFAFLKDHFGNEGESFDPFPVDELHSFVLDEIILAMQRLEKIKPKETSHAERSKI